MSIEASRQATVHIDPQLPSGIAARLVAVSAGLLMAVAGGILAADLPAVDPAVVAATTHQQPV